MTFSPFDPLESKTTKVTEAALSAVKREIENILSSYVGWYDPFCELIQNALDAVEMRAANEKSSGAQDNYKPKIRIKIDLDGNALTVSDNGIALDKEKFEQFLAPNFSFKSGKTRGHKGVGATYVAYGFNYMRVSTKSPGFSASGRIVGARNWLKDANLGTNPKVEPDSSAISDAYFDTVDRGVSITVRFDDSTHPKKLDWIKATNAAAWAKILRVKTGLGAIFADQSVAITIECISAGKNTIEEIEGTGYLWLHKMATKCASARNIYAESDRLHTKLGASYRLPDKYRNLDFIYDSWKSEELKSLPIGSIGTEELAIIEKYDPYVSFEFGYTTKLWSKFNNELNLRELYTCLT